MEHPFRDEEEIFGARISSRLDLRDGLIQEALRKLREAGFEPDPFFDRLILDEAISNAIIHGNGGDPSKEVAFRLFAAEDCWGAQVADQGAGFDWKAALKRAEMAPSRRSTSTGGMATTSGWPGSARLRGS